jgi:hypothetical protein
MPENDAFADRRRASEEDYFKKKDRELVERMRKAAAAEQARREMGAKVSVDDPELIREMEALGFTPDTIGLLPLVPVVQMAWAEGGVSDSEGDLLVKLARSRGITEGSAADQQLSEWLKRRPDAQVFARGMRLIRAMFDTPSQERNLNPDDLVSYCESIAAASGGFLGINKISPEERALLATITAALKSRQP